MSGFGGVFHLDGAPVDRAWLETMANFLAFRGPDGSQVWVSGNAGLCHTLLRVSNETDGRPQIARLDDHLWIAGDVRVDDRDTLIAKLPGAALELKSASSSELILHAYAAWGEACLDHLLGDFSFVIWDAPRQRVFGARDHMGVKPFFYTQVGQCLLISNTLDCIRQIPTVPDELDDPTIGDFLLMGERKKPAATFFKAIRRLPAAHRLTAGAKRLRTERYWTLPIEEPIYYKRRGEYIERFHELLRAAVCDRLPKGPLGILMSGGLDSPALAVASVQLGAAATAFTAVYDRLVPDQERHFATLVAQHLGIPIHYIVRDDEPFGWESGSAPIHTPEPMADPLVILAMQGWYRDIAASTRVCFSGFGPDAALTYEWLPHLSWLIHQRRWGRLCKDLIFDFGTSPRVPYLHRLPQMWRAGKEPDSYTPSLPRWLNKEFETRLRLRARWEDLTAEVSSPHPTRRAAYATFARDFSVDDGYDPGCTRVAVEFLYPFLDLRLLRYLLTVPAVPWCRDKCLIRTALIGLLPEAVRLRPSLSTWMLECF
jgi:asparagine synthase (glutamine-hydrolysing)